MKHPLACRSGIFGAPARAFVTLAQCGITRAEPTVDADTNFSHLQEQADAAGVTISTVSAGVNLDDDASREAFASIIRSTGGIGTPILFCSLKSEAPGSAESILRLQRLADLAADHGVVLSMETHPPFGTNAGTALQTIELVDRPTLRYNFDTANIYYYNHGLDTVKELSYCRDVVASVHLKDSDGAFHSMAMPCFGDGIVDFAGVFSQLDAVGFDGPCTMELEGESLEAHPAGKVDFLQRCIAYLQELDA